MLQELDQISESISRRSKLAGATCYWFQEPQNWKGAQCTGSVALDQIFIVLVVVVPTKKTSMAFPQEHVFLEKLSHCFERG